MTERRLTTSQLAVVREYKQLMFARQSGKCHYCGVQMTLGKDDGHWNQATIDHVHPVSRGGIPTDVFNMVLACAWCNKAKGRMSAEWFAMRMVSA